MGRGVWEGPLVWFMIFLRIHFACQIEFVFKSSGEANIPPAESNNLLGSNPYTSTYLDRHIPRSFSTFNWPGIAYKKGLHLKLLFWCISVLNLAYDVNAFTEKQLFDFATSV